MLIIVRLANHPKDTTSSRPVENITTRNKWLEPIGSNWQQYGLSPIAANRAKGKYTQIGNLLLVALSSKVGCFLLACMSLAISVPWSSVEAKSPQAPVQIDKLSNYDLILRCQSERSPDRAAFSELLRRYQSHVERVLYHLAPDWQDRADLTQEVWIRVYRNIKRLQEPVKFRGWLSRIATNLFYDELRKRKRVASPLSLDAPRFMEDGEMNWEIAGENPSPEEELTTQEFYEQLQEAISDLPEVFRTTIVLREIEGLAYEDIAEITKVSLGTVKSRIARARTRLQSQLQSYLDG